MEEAVDAFSSLLSAILLTFASIWTLVRTHRINTALALLILTCALTACLSVFVFMRTRMRTWAIRRRDQKITSAIGELVAVA